MSTIQEQNIWFSGPYKPREGDYAKSLMEVKDADLVRLVQERAQEDGDWIIKNELLDEGLAKMHKMMEWVSRPENIHQCAEANLIENPTIDWICRELANAVMFIGGSRG